MQNIYIDCLDAVRLSSSSCTKVLACRSKLPILLHQDRSCLSNAMQCNAMQCNAILLMPCCIDTAATLRLARRLL